MTSTEKNNQSPGGELVLMRGMWGQNRFLKTAQHPSLS